MLSCTRFRYYILERFTVKKQSCAGNMIWRQLKQRMARVKLHIFLFHLKFVKMKTFFAILALKQPNSEKRIFAVYKYSRRLLNSALSPKFVMTFLWLAYSLSNFNLLESNGWFSNVKIEKKISQWVGGVGTY